MGEIGGGVVGRGNRWGGGGGGGEGNRWHTPCPFIQ